MTRVASFRVAVVLVVLCTLATACATDEDAASQECPADWALSEGQACGDEALVCGAEVCDACEACETLRCVAGTWRRSESEAPSCPQQGGTADAIGAVDGIGYTDASSSSYTPPPMATVACHGDAMDIKYRPCATEGETCGTEDCADPCSNCWFVACRQGEWTSEHIGPAPDCYPASAEVVDDVSCSTHGCYKTPICGEACDHGCGCCACEPGQTYCGGVGGGEDANGNPMPTPYSHAVFECQGTCFAPTVCAEGDVCVDEPPYTATCLRDVTSCEDIQGMLDASIERNSLCKHNDCRPDYAACAPGSVDGFLPVNEDARHYGGSEETRDLMARAVEMGCFPDEACDSTPAGLPKIRCVGGLCVFVD
jgi:hypothetical protein